MIRKPNGSDAKRLGTGVLVAGVVAAGAVALANPASAATSGTITATASPTNNQTGQSTTVTYSDTATSATATAAATIISGSGKITGALGSTAYPAADDFGNKSGTFGVTEASAGTTVVRVFNDANANSSFDAGEDYVDLTINFTGAPDSITQTPATASTSVGIYSNFTDATTTGGKTSGNAPVTVALSETVPTTQNAPKLSLANSTGTAYAAGTVTTSVSGTNTTYTDTFTGDVTTDGTGSATFGATSDTNGTVTVVSSSSTGASASSTLTVAGGQTGNNAVAKVAVNSAQTANTGGTVSYTVTTTDSNGNPVSGAQVYYVINSGPDAAPTSYQPFGTTTAPKGQVTGTITNGGTAGTDSIEFYVNTTTGTGTHGLGPDGNDPTTTTTATFSKPVEVDNLKVTSSYDTAANNPGFAPSGTTPLSFTATATNNPTTGQSGQQPVSGVTVTFTIVTTPSGGTATTTTQTGVTGADGTATISVSPSSTTNGTTVQVSATAGTGTSNTDTVTYQDRSTAAGAFTLTPAVQSAAAGSTISVTAKVVDQFGTGVSGQSISYTVSGRNGGKSGTVTTGPNGTATITYTDSGTSGTTDTITATDNTTGTFTSGQSATQTAQVNYVSSVSPASVTVTPPTETDGVSGAATQQIQATVTNATTNGTTLANVPVTFTVSQGFVSVTNGDTTSTATTVTAYTNGNGVATAYVGSEQSGTQTVTATAGTVSGTSKITYNPGNAVKFTLTPTGVTVQPGTSQQFTAMTTDQYGNGTPDYIYFSQSGPGVLNQNNGYNYSPNGVANVLLTVPANATPGSGLITAYSDDLNTSANATYTVPAPTTVKSVAVSVSGGATVGSTATATATVTGSDGKPFAGETVNFSVSGATVTTGSAVTNSNGVATLTFTAQNAGTFTVKATSSSNTAATGSASGTTSKSSPTVGPKTYVTVTSPYKGTVTAVAYVSGAASGVKVFFYTVVNGKPTYSRRGVTGSSGNTTVKIRGLKSGSTITIETRSIDPEGPYSTAHSVKVK